MKKTAALLFQGLSPLAVVYAEEKRLRQSPCRHACSETDGYSRKSRSGDDFVTLNFTNIDISALVKVMSELMRQEFHSRRTRNRKGDAHDADQDIAGGSIPGISFGARDKGLYRC